MSELRRILASNLRLQKTKPRDFVLSASGGVDSTVTAHLLAELREEYSLRLSLFHMNFGLRGKDSVRDARFVTELAKKLKIEGFILEKKILKKTGIQELARKLRLEAAATVRPSAEWIEAHHRDDQVETFLFRLFRGSGLKGLTGMKLLRLREGRLVWRPWLGIPKKELIEYARLHRISFREDVSNQTDLYDRNFIRKNVLPLIEERFPSARDAILRTLAQIQEEDLFFKEEHSKIARTVLPDNTPTVWQWDELLRLSPPLLHRFIHGVFQDSFGIQVSRAQVLEISERLQGRKPFSYNAPHGVVLRGRLKSRSLASSQVFLQGMGASVGTFKPFKSFEDDNFQFDIILKNE